MPLPSGPVPGNWLLSGHLDQRVPVVRGVDLRRVARRGGEDRAQGDLVSETPADPVGVDQPVAADPEVVGRLRELGQQEAPVVVGDDDLDELRLQVVGLGDHPDACLRAIVATDDAGDHAVVRQLPGSRRLVRPGQRDRQRTGRRRDAERAVSHAHVRPLLGVGRRSTCRIWQPYAHHSSPWQRAPLHSPGDASCPTALFPGAGTAPRSPFAQQASSSTPSGAGLLQPADALRSAGALGVRRRPPGAVQRAGFCHGLPAGSRNAGKWISRPAIIPGGLQDCGSREVSMPIRSAAALALLAVAAPALLPAAGRRGGALW